MTTTTPKTRVTPHEAAKHARVLEHMSLKPGEYLASCAKSLLDAASFLRLVEHAAPAAPAPEPAADDSPRARLYEVGNQIHNLGCENQSDEALSSRLEGLRSEIWALAALLPTAAPPAPVAASAVGHDALRKAFDAGLYCAETKGTPVHAWLTLIGEIGSAPNPVAPAAYLVDGRIEQGLFFDKAAAEVMAEANCGTVVPLGRLNDTASSVRWRQTVSEPIYRFLSVGEVIEKGDECPTDNCDAWLPVDHWAIGGKVSEIFKTIRRRIVQHTPEGETDVKPNVEPVEPTHRHVKRGTLYRLLGYGKMQAKDWFLESYGQYGRVEYLGIDMAEVAIYQSVDDGSMWVRPREEFEDGRFEVLKEGATDGEA